MDLKKTFETFFISNDSVSDWLICFSRNISYEESKIL